MKSQKRKVVLLRENFILWDHGISCINNDLPVAYRPVKNQNPQPNNFRSPKATVLIGKTEFLSLKMGIGDILIRQLPRVLRARLELNTNGRWYVWHDYFYPVRPLT